MLLQQLKKMFIMTWHKMFFLKLKIEKDFKYMKVRVIKVSWYQNIIQSLLSNRGNIKPEQVSGDSHVHREGSTSRRREWSSAGDEDRPCGRQRHIYHRATTATYNKGNQHHPIKRDHIQCFEIKCGIFFYCNTGFLKLFSWIIFMQSTGKIYQNSPVSQVK